MFSLANQAWRVPPDNAKGKPDANLKKLSMKQQNNFDTLRIISALVVAFSHAVPLSYGSNSLEPVWRLSKGQATAGTTAVVIFFVISGYLITQSFVKSQDVYRFAMARMLRIVPALLVVLSLVL